MKTPTTCRYILAAGCSLLATVAAAQDAPVTLRVADHYSTTNKTAGYTIKFFMDEVSAHTDKVKFDYYPAEQMGKAKDLLSLTQQGVVDVGFVAPAYVPDKMPLSGVAELPGTYDSSCEGVHAYWKLAKDGIIGTQDFEANGIKPLFVYMLSPYQILTREPIKTAADIKGQKLRSAGAGQDLTIGAIGAVPVRLGGADVYEAITRGTLDGAVFPLQAAVEFRLTEDLKASTVDANFGGFATAYAISLDKWNALPDDVKTMMDEAGEATVKNACEHLDADNAGPALDALKAEGVTYAPLPDDVMAEFKEALSGVNVKWAESLDARGKPGTETLNAYLDALKNAGDSDKAAN